MNNTFKKIIVCFSFCCILVGLFPLNVFADDVVGVTKRLSVTFKHLQYEELHDDELVWVGTGLPSDSLSYLLRWNENATEKYALIVSSSGGSSISSVREFYCNSVNISSDNYSGEMDFYSLEVPNYVNAGVSFAGLTLSDDFSEEIVCSGYDCTISGSSLKDCMNKIFFYQKEGTVSEGMNFLDNVENELPSDLGYLDDVFVKYLFKYGENYSVGTEEDINRICFSQYSTTGVDLLSGSYSIRLYEKFSVYKRSDPDVDIYPDLPLVLIGEYSPKDLFIDYNSIDAMAHTSSVTGDVEGFNSWNIVIKQLIRNDNIYLQIVHKTTSGDICGGYLCFNGTAKDDEDSLSTMTTLNPDLTVDTSDGGFVDKNYETTQGVGVDYEEAEHNADKHYQEVQNGGGGVSSSINDIVSQVGNMPQVIGKLFSFLPPWCLAFVGIAIGLWVTLMIIKAIRG